MYCPIKHSHSPSQFACHKLHKKPFATFHFAFLQLKAQILRRQKFYACNWQLIISRNHKLVNKSYQTISREPFTSDHRGLSFWIAENWINFRKDITKRSTVASKQPLSWLLSCFCNDCDLHLVSFSRSLFWFPIHLTRKHRNEWLPSTSQDEILHRRVVIT